MAIIRKKTWRDMFEKVLSGDKTFDVRLADFDVSEGDTLVLEEWDEEKQVYTGRKIEAKVGFVLKTKDLKFWPEADVAEHGYQVISLK